MKRTYSKHIKNLLPGMMCRAGGIFHGAAVIVLFVTVTPRAFTIAYLIYLSYIGTHAPD